MEGLIVGVMEFFYIYKGNDLVYFYKRAVFCDVIKEKGAWLSQNVVDNEFFYIYSTSWASLIDKAGPISAWIDLVL